LGVFLKRRTKRDGEEELEEVSEGGGIGEDAKRAREERGRVAD